MKALILITTFLSTFAWTSYAYLNVSPYSINFGRVKIGDYNSSRSIWVRNYGDEPTRVHVRETFCNSDFYISNNCRFELRPNASCTLTVSYRPYSEGYDSCTIEFSNDDYQRTSLRVNGEAVRR